MRRRCTLLVVMEVIVRHQDRGASACRPAGSTDPGNRRLYPPAVGTAATPLVIGRKEPGGPAFRSRSATAAGSAANAQGSGTRLAADMGVWYAWLPGSPGAAHPGWRSTLPDMDRHERREKRSGSAAHAAEWDARYSERDGARWSRRPNGRLLAEVADLTPGRALDVGCGEGADGGAGHQEHEGEHG